MHPAGYEPMLATRGPVPEGDGWAFDAKMDGWRTLVHVNGRRVSVFSRPGRDITTAVPSLAGLADAVPDGTVLDGELVAGDGRASSFYRIGALVAANPDVRRTPLTFVAFDLLAVDGRRLTGTPFVERRRLLEELRFLSPDWVTAAQWVNVPLADLLTSCERLDVEGVVAKKLTSSYRYGQRSSDWRKIKTVSWLTRHAPYRHQL
jgi:bifunctional non-homologous end joining protein LigD